MPKTTLAYEDYIETPLPGAPGATLVSYREDTSVVPIAVHHGVFDAVERVMEAHRYWTAAFAAREAIRIQSDDGIEAWLKANGGQSPQLAHFRSARREERRKVEETILAQALMHEDPYRATRAIEDEFRVVGTQALHDLVAAAFKRSREDVRNRHARWHGATRLRDANTAPSTALGRHLAALWGKDQAPLVPYPVPGRADELTLCLGTVLVEPDSCLSPTRFTGRIELTVTVSLHPEFIEFNPDGGIDFASLDMKIVHDPALWSTARDGHLYGDEPTEAAVNALLAGIGSAATANWSEQGRQESDAGDMDVSSCLAEELWPEVVADRRAQAVQATPAA